SDPAAVQDGCLQAMRQLGHIDVLINNAAIAQQKLFTDITDADWRRMMGVNLDGVFYCCRAVLPGMIRRKFGRILMVSSMWGQTGASCEVHYSAAKAGICRGTMLAATDITPRAPSAICGRTWSSLPE
ncbi:MAG: SDR family NAD(P)-dependent oxidoreductase, partial [Clostridia bacterium]|nr:SDR family NAD(P)-dependent oxidoreductase [Clostridia bacterium]